MMGRRLPLIAFIASVTVLFTNPGVALEQKKCTEDMFTVILPTYKQGPFHPTVLWQFDVLHEYICEIVLVWDLPDQESVSALKKELDGFRIEVRFDIKDDRPGTLNNRFLPHDELRTDAVLQIDDDIFIRPQGLVSALSAFKKYPDQLLSFASCVHIANGKRYQTLWPMAFNTSCEMGMTNAAMLHKKYHKLYWEETVLLELVKLHHNCEDIGMNFVIEKELRRSQATSGEVRELGTNLYFYPPTRMFINENHLKQGSIANPVLKNSPYYDEKFDEGRLTRWKSGISTSQEGHGGMRDRCIGEFTRLFELQPNIQSPFALSWHPSCLPAPFNKRIPHDYFPGEIKWDHTQRQWVDFTTKEKIGHLSMLEGLPAEGFITISNNPKYINLGPTATEMLNNLQG
eukprot:m.98957 g.98957  ORF g.98957 m.98957 type:complete len:401 (-) comp27117_c0_seq1:84-1286(-)